jgi:hypothetical protein
MPVIIYSDGGPQFKDEFDDFCKTWSIKHVKSSPHYPQSNGVAESTVKEIKKSSAPCLTTGQGCSTNLD